LAESVVTRLRIPSPLKSANAVSMPGGSRANAVLKAFPPPFRQIAELQAKSGRPSPSRSAAAAWRFPPSNPVGCVLVVKAGRSSPEETGVDPSRAAKPGLKKLVTPKTWMKG
jgi:hypothetical protein